ncbi:hypothetical protein AWB64_02667 [Caballeronia sordidicola]|uniref:Uncharacterized protein n=2 Tax=Caballeronia sordidicola TaxID=196367 RepID=A0A158GFY4_CABSO|nr:hypothetical protein AWB64_02667 [Caballeronia sordidicola]
MPNLNREMNLMSILSIFRRAQVAHSKATWLSELFVPKRRKAISTVVMTAVVFVQLTGCALAQKAPVDAASRPVTDHKKVLYVTRLKHRDREEDDKVRAHLEERGMIVTMVDQTSPASAAAGQDLVVISSVVSARDMVGTSFRDVPLPLLTWESDLFDSLRFTGQKKGEDFGTLEKEHYINVVNAPSPLAGGVPAGKRWVYPRDGEMGWGKPAPGATVIATVPGEPDEAVLFAYEKGATMDYDFIAPARRVAVFLGNRTFEKLSADGTTLFDAALDWAVSAPVSPTRHPELPSK